MQKKAEEIVQYYCVSDIGLTIYSKPVRRTYGFREGKEDVETLFATEFLQRHADPGLAKPMAGMIAKIEARTSSELSRTITAQRIALGIRPPGSQWRRTRVVCRRRSTRSCARRTPRSRRAWWS